VTGAAEVFVAALVTDLATGLGVLPVAAAPRADARGPGVATAVAAGMMLSASVFALADKALRLGQAVEVVAGVLAGAAFFALSSRLVSTRRWRLRNMSEDDSRQPIVVIGTMFVHSIPEGVAIGVGYATGEVRFGLLLAIAIAVHNIPEGTAVAVPLRARGASVGACFWWAVVTSVPQPIVAVPAYLLISVAQPLLAASLGFAGGAMIFLVVAELLPESYASSSKLDTAWGVTIGLVAMLGFTAALGL
jgi:zinc transporter ZupT